MDKQVFSVPCQNYQSEEINNAVTQLFYRIGGLKRFVHPGQTVLLKNNLLMKKNPDAGVTTHPALTEAITKKIQSLGAKVIIADSPGGPFNKNWLKGIYRETGMEQITQKTGAQLNWNFNQQDHSFPEGHLLKKITLCQIVKEVDVVISIAKLKTHGFTLYTGAVKNLFGAVPGLLKADYHLRMNRVTDFSMMLVDLAEFIKPELSIMDAVIGMEGAGPSSGNPKQLGFIAASTNPHALDLACCHHIGLKAQSVSTLGNAIERNLIPKDFQNLEIVGKPLCHLEPVPFKIPANSRDGVLPFPLPPSIDRFFSNILRPKPHFVHSKCVGCGICAKNCPAKCIKMIDSRPYPDLSQCIRCFCCQELCPYHAVEIKRGRLSNLLFR